MSWQARNRADRWANLMASEYGYKEFDAPTVLLRFECVSWAGWTGHGNSINRGLAAMPAQERSLAVDGRGLGGDQSYNQRRHREAMARNTSPQGSESAVLTSSPCRWTMPIGIMTMTRRRGHRARRLLSRSNSGFHRFGDQLRGAAPMARRRALGQAPRHRDRGIAGDLRRMLRRAVVAARRRSDQSRNGDAMAGRGDRGKYRPRQYRRGRRHPDRTRRPDPHRRAHPRHHR